MSYLISNIPHFSCWVRREFTCNHQNYHGDFLHAMAFAVNTIPDRSLSFQVVFTGCEIDREDGPDENIHGGAMWARMPIQALVADIPVENWPDPMEDHICQPWDCESRHHSVIVMDRVSSSPWLCKIDGEFYPALWRTGDGVPDFTPSQWTHSAESHQSYLDPSVTFNNLYASK